ncbi:MAG: DUF1002 domain-containing protein [Atopobiaceae bacterium]|nr:DUF1002 domain-containing protein [Atopobiaceae bacterium]
MKRISSLAKRVVALMAAIGIVFASMPTAAFADSSRVVTMGADLSAEQRATVLKFFGLTENDLKNLTVVNVTNQDERSHLSDSIDLGIIGNKTYSCSYIQPTNSGGIYVQTANLNYVTNYMLYNALQTAGVKNCNLVVTAPFEVSGTGALTGVFMAYEAQGQNLDDKKEKVATEELVTTAQLGETYGEGVAEVVSDVKDKVVSKGGNLSDDDIRDIIRQTASAKGITLSDEDLDKLMQIIKRLQELNYDPDAFSTTLKDFQSKLDEVTKKAQESGGIFEAIGNFFKGIADWFAGLFNGGKTPSTQEVSQGTQDFFNNFNTDVFQWDGAKPGSSSSSSASSSSSVS